jgi:hypothetical protein
MTEWTWKFSDARVLEQGEMKDVVNEVSYVLTGTHDGQVLQSMGRVVLPKPDKNAFIPFENLTESHLLRFLAEVVNVDALKARIEACYGDPVAIQPIPLKQFPFGDA